MQEADRILLAILGIVTTLLLWNATRIALGDLSSTAPMPVARRVCRTCSRAGRRPRCSSACSCGRTCCWCSGSSPTCRSPSTCTSSRRRPTSTSRRTGPRGYLEPLRIDLEGPEEDLRFGVATARDLSKKQLLDLFSCTECGRCQEVCPAWNTGQAAVSEAADHGPPRSRRRHRSRRDGGRHRGVAAARARARSTDEVVWDCVTCGACVRECPVDIEHVDTIVDLRRNLVMAESRFPSEAGAMLRGVEGPNENPWSQPASARTDWIGDIPVRVLQPGRAGAGVPVLGRVRGRVRRAGEADDTERRPAAERRRRRLGDPRAARAMHRRPRPSHGPRVPLPDPRRAERRDVRGGGRPQGGRDLRALLQHPGERVPGLRRDARGRAPHGAVVAPARRAAAR